MTPIASRLLLAIALAGCQATQALAADALPLTSLDAPLPAFVPNSGRGNFTTALNDNRASATAARRAAEALSAKFTDITTNSIAKDDSPTTITPAPAPVPAAKPAPAAPVPTHAPVAAVDPPHIVTTHSSRSFVLASRQADGDNKARAPSRRRSTTNEKRHRVPRAVATPVGEASNGSADGQKGSGQDLAAIGTKVGFLDLLTNPSLWSSPFAAKP